MYMYKYEKRVKYYGHIENHNDEISECWSVKEVDRWN